MQGQARGTRPTTRVRPSTPSDDSEPRWSPGAIEEAVLGAVARGTLEGLSWFDGACRSRSFIGAQPDRVVQADTLTALDEVEALWRDNPSQVWMGWMTYELGADHLLGRSPGRGPSPGLCLRRYPGAVELDGDTVRSHGDPGAVSTLFEALGSPRSPSAPTLPSWPLQPLVSTLEPALHRSRVAQALAHIAAGDSYQINLSQPFFAPWASDAPHGSGPRAAATYGHLRERRPAQMGALVELGDGRWFVSNSPETLLDVRWGARPSEPAVARSWPIKGTRPRYADPVADAAAREALWCSEKERAEHLMIVDLVRNDLGRLAIPGTVRATRQPSPMALPTVHHLVTEVRAHIDPQTSLRAMVEAVFPGGSITGAPKRRTVELIDALEEHPRGIYCGALVLLEPAGLTLSIPIRTGVLGPEGLLLCAGGGIVIDSDPEAERQETIAKTMAFVGP